MAIKCSINEAKLSQALKECAGPDKDGLRTICELTGPTFTAIIQNMVFCEKATLHILKRGYTVIWNASEDFIEIGRNPIPWMLLIMRHTALEYAPPELGYDAEHNLHGCSLEGTPSIIPKVK